MVKQLAFLTVMLFLVLVLVFLLLPQLNPEVRAARERDAIERGQWLNVLFEGGVILLLAGGACAVGWGAGQAGQSIRNIWLVWHKHGLQPGTLGHVTVSKPAHSDRAQEIAALTQGNVDRLNAPVAKWLLPNEELAALPEPEPPLMLTAGEAVDVDLRVCPHTLLVGNTGGGKSTAARFIMARIAQRYRCEFLILEPGGINWSGQAAAYSAEGIVQALDAAHRELDSRVTLMRDAGVEYFTDLPQQRPFECVVFEEMDRVIERLTLMDRSQAKQATIQLHDIVSMGRKAGICLFAVTTSATADVFDRQSVRNASNVFLFRNSQQVARDFGIDTKATGLNMQSIPVGSAYSLAHGQIVAFPEIARPSLPVSGLYRELPGSVQETVQEPVYRPEVAFQAGTSGTVPGIPQDREPYDDDAAMRLIYRTWLETVTDAMPRGNLKEVERRLYDGQEGGVKFYWVRRSVAIMRGRAERGEL